MRCPFCRSDNDRVIDSRAGDDGASIRRRRECLSCKKRFTTYERFERQFLAVVKKDGEKVAHYSSKVIETLQNGIGFIREIILGQSQNIHISIFSEADLTVRKAQSDYMFIGQAPRYIVEGLGMIIIVGIAYFNVSNNSVGNASILPFLALLALALLRFKALYINYLLIIMF